MHHPSNLKLGPGGQPSVEQGDARPARGAKGLRMLFFTRFYRLTTLPFWPLTDEGIIGLLGMGQSQQWQWHFLWSEVHLEPMLIWLLGLYFKILEPSFFSLRLLPSLFSIATSWAAYGAARQYCSKSISFIFCWILSFSFWEFTLSRDCAPFILVPFFQCLCFAWLGRFLNRDRGASGWKPLLILSLLTGLGFYTWTNWIAVWLSITLILFIIFYFDQSQNKIRFTVFLLATLLTALPLLQARLAPDGMAHFHEVGGLPAFKTVFLYVKGIFWNSAISFPYGSNWGGFFNPILDSFIFLGILHLFQTGKKYFVFFFILCLFFSFLPGAFTKSVELCRILCLFPFFAFLAALGIRCLWLARRKLGVPSLLLLCILGSLGLDIYNYVFRYNNIRFSPPAQQWRNEEYFHAYEILKKQSDQTGPIYLFSEFGTDYDNKTLNITSYPFDALQNPRLSQSHPQWAALLEHKDYASFLKKRFPDLSYEWLDETPTPQGHHTLALFLIPVAEIPPKELDTWIQADRTYRKVNLNTKDKSSLYPWGRFPEQFADLQTLFPSDPFLTAVYWEKFASFKLMNGDFALAAQAYQKAAQKGYPAAHLYRNEAIALDLIGKKEEAAKISQLSEKMRSQQKNLEPKSITEIDVISKTGP